LSLTPAYDICPQARPTREANQALVLGDDDRRSLLATCVAISNKFLLRSEDARALIDGLIDHIVANWESVCDEARLGDATRRMLAGRQFLNPYAFEGYGPVPGLR
jgi:serine/threonine-protein kinase HipA